MAGGPGWPESREFFTAVAGCDFSSLCREVKQWNWTMLALSPRALWKHFLPECWASHSKPVCGYCAYLLVQLAEPSPENSQSFASESFSEWPLLNCASVTPLLPILRVRRQVRLKRSSRENYKVESSSKDYMTLLSEKCPPSCHPLMLQPRSEAIHHFLQLLKINRDESY